MAVNKKTPAPEFSNLTPAEKRVAIAKDVIATLRRKKTGYNAEHAGYCSFGLGKLPSTGDLQAALPKAEKHCTVCAMGALFISHVRIANSVKIDGTYYGDDEIISALRGIFSTQELRKIEQAFEGFSPIAESDYDYLWNTAYDNPTARLRAICENIVRNNGSFKIKEVTPPTKSGGRK